MDRVEATTWSTDWAWGLPLIVLTVVIHVCGLGLITEIVGGVVSKTEKGRRFMLFFIGIVGVAALLATTLHALAAAIWAAAFVCLGALPDTKSAMLFSLNAMTTYGQTDIRLPDHWRLMGALAALNGMLLFGLTTAFLFAIIQKAWPLGRPARLRRRDLRPPPTL